MKKLKFAKMQALGNDFILVENLSGRIEFSPEEIKALCDRHFGVGADGILLIEDSRSADLKMRIFNADGSEAETCGNGIRCFARYAHQRGLLSREDFTVETGGGVSRVKVRGGKVEVSLGRPRFEPSEVPVKLKGKAINRKVTVGGGSEIVTCLSLGNPHCVVFLPPERRVDLAVIGPKISNDPLFPKKTNVEFARVVTPRELKVGVYERGVGPTLACGTGAAAAVVAGILSRKIHRRAVVRLAGGDLEVRWPRGGEVSINGPAEFVFTGSI